MRTPSEQQTRAFLKRLGMSLMLLDDENGLCKKIVVREADGSSAWEFRSLDEAWERWADIALDLRLKEELISAVTARWNRSSPRTRRTIERFLEGGANGAGWSGPFQSTWESLPSFGITYDRLRRQAGWARQLARDMKANDSARCPVPERILRKIQAAKAK